MYYLVKSFLSLTNWLQQEKPALKKIHVSCSLRTKTCFSAVPPLFIVFSDALKFAITGFSRAVLFSNEILISSALISSDPVIKLVEEAFSISLLSLASLNHHFHELYYLNFLIITGLKMEVNNVKFIFTPDIIILCSEKDIDIYFGFLQK